MVEQQRRGGVERVEDGHVPQRVWVDVRRTQQPRGAGRLEALCDQLSKFGDVHKLLKVSSAMQHLRLLFSQGFGLDVDKAAGALH